VYEIDRMDGFRCISFVGNVMISMKMDLDSVMNRPLEQNAVRYVILRHGQTDWNVNKRIQGDSDISCLTPDGIDQAYQLSNVLQNALQYSSIQYRNKYYVSSLKRARQTAEIILHPVNSKSISIDHRLREITLPWQGMYKSEIQSSSEFSWMYSDFQMKSNNYSINSDEHKSIFHLWNRTQQFLNDTLTSNSTQDPIVHWIVSHNHTSKAILGSLLHLETRFHSVFSIGNCSISVIDEYNAPKHHKKRIRKLVLLNWTPNINISTKTNSSLIIHRSLTRKNSMILSSLDQILSVVKDKATVNSSEIVVTLPHQESHFHTLHSELLHHLTTAPLSTLCQIHIDPGHCTVLNIPQHHYASIQHVNVIMNSSIINQR